MEAKEHSMVMIQRAFALLLSLLHFLSLPNKRLGGPVTTKVRDFCHANDKMLIKTLLQALPLWYCFWKIKNLRYHLMPLQNRFIV